MKILLVDDDKLVLNSLKIIVESAGHNVVGMLTDPTDVAGIYRRFLPDIVIMDIRMGEKDGITSSRDLLLQFPAAKILLLTTFKDEEYIAQAINLGVRGYILKEAVDQLPAAIQAVLSGSFVFGEEVVKSISIKQPRRLTATGLSEQEIKITECVAQGMSNKEIAAELHLSEGTIRNYISKILEKLDLRDRTQLAVFYYKN